jgi:heme-degrading monooxygenase HmoA
LPKHCSFPAFSPQHHNGETIMIAVLFEAKAEPAHQARYLQLAAELKPLLADIDGFIDIERFQSLTTDGKILSLSWWRDEEAVRRWKQNVFHQAAQAGAGSIFAFYRIRVAQVVREYSSETGGHAMYDVHVIFWRAWTAAGAQRRGAGGRRRIWRCPFSGGRREKAARAAAGFTVQAVRKPVIRAGAPGEHCGGAGGTRRVYPYPVQRPCESPYSADG